MADEGKVVGDRDGFLRADNSAQTDGAAQTDSSTRSDGAAQADRPAWSDGSPPVDRSLQAGSFSRASDLSHTNGSHQPVSLIIPGRADYLVLCRLVAGAIGGQETADEEAIADLKLIVTEACNCFLEREPSGPQTSGIEVQFAPLPGGLAITVTDPERRFQLRPAQDERGGLTETGLALTIMRALADEVEQAESETGGTILRLVKRLRPVSDRP